MDIVIVFQQMLVLFAMMVTGFVTYQRGWISDDNYNIMSKLVVNIFNPILIISSVLGKSAESAGTLFRQNLVLVILLYALLFAASFLFVILLRPSSVESPIYQLLIIFPNTGFMGIPLVAALLGSEYIIYVAVYMLGYNILIYTYGIYLAGKSRRAQQAQENQIQEKQERNGQQVWKKLMTNPGIVASAIAFVIFFLQISVPGWIQSYCSYMGNASIPLSMFLIGCSVAASNIKNMLRDVRIYAFLLFRMLLIPIAGSWLTRVIPYDAVMLQLFVIMLAMPSGSLVVLIAEEYGSKTDCAAKGVVLSTLLSIVTIPIVSLFL